MAKHVKTHPDWLKADHVIDVYSVSNCVSKDFVNHVTCWKYNGYGFFNSPETIREVAEEHFINLTKTKLFFYEVYALQYDEDEKSWKSFASESSFETQVSRPDEKTLEGYDVVSFCFGTNPGCSPLSCNSLASEMTTNEHCLLPSFQKAKELLEQDRFAHSEPGPYRIFAVYSAVWPPQSPPVAEV